MVLRGIGRLDNVALTERSSLRVTKAHYWPFTILSDHHYPLLFVVKVPAIRVSKPQAGCTPRMTESHMLPVHFTADQKHSYATAVYNRDRGDPVSHSRDFITKLQMAMYKWAKDLKKVEDRHFAGLALEERGGNQGRNWRKTYGGAERNAPIGTGLSKASPARTQ